MSERITRLISKIDECIDYFYGDRVAAIEAADGGIIEFGAGIPPVLLRSGVLWWAE